MEINSKFVSRYFNTIKEKQIDLQVHIFVICRNSFYEQRYWLTLILYVHNIK